MNEGEKTNFTVRTSGRGKRRIIKKQCDVGYRRNNKNKKSC